MVDGQINVRDAIAGTIHYQSPEGKTYQLQEKSSHSNDTSEGGGILKKNTFILRDIRFQEA